MPPGATRWARTLQAGNHWLVGQAARLAITGLRRFPLDRALDFADRTARRLGPLFGRHRTAVNNLREAFPDKTPEEIETLAGAMWGHLGRLGAEYFFLDQIFDYDPDAAEPGRVEVGGRHIFERIAAEKRPRIIFTAHLGCFELLPVAAAAFGLDLTVLFRTPNNPFVADFVTAKRKRAMGRLLASRAGVVFELSRLLEKGGNVGLLVDQRFNNGSVTTFFGRRCQTNPLLGKLARQHECDVYPARCIRLPGNRYRMEIEEKLDLPRELDGRVDVHATSQMLNDVVERWVREHPEQWLWIHKRWAWGWQRQRGTPAPAATNSSGE